MKYINKSPEPSFFTEWKNKENVDVELNSSRLPKHLWDMLKNPEKKELRKNLVEEQNYLCCYCGERIDIDHKTTLEHLLPKNHYKALMFTYKNLIASCNVQNQCNNKKSDYLLKVHPRKKHCEKRFSFDISGMIKGMNNKTKNSIETLGLNNQTPKNRRKEKYYLSFKYIISQAGKINKKLLLKNVKILNQKNSVEQWNALRNQLTSVEKQKIKSDLLNGVYKPDAEGKIEPFAFVLKYCYEKYL